MKSNQFVVAALVLVAVAASACGPSSVGAAPANQAPAANPPAAAVAAPSEAPTPDSSSSTGAGSGSQSTSAPTPDSSSTGSQPAAAPAQSGGAAVNVANGQLGSFLVDDKGMTLYLFTKDSPGTSTCYDKCATAWPPLLTSGNATAGAGVDASKLGTTARTDGTTQVTYNGWPLYYFAKDKQAGDTTGQGVGSVWYVVSPAGDAMQ